MEGGKIREGQKNEGKRRKEEGGRLMQTKWNEVRQEEKKVEEDGRR